MRDILDYWFDGWSDAVDTPFAQDPALRRWWMKDEAVDAHITTTFGHLLEQDLDAWEATPTGRLAKVIVLDQFSRVVHRGSGRSFENDAEARATLARALRKGEDLLLEPIQRYFLYMPLMHSEDLADHDLALQKFGALVEHTRDWPRAANYENALAYERKHRDIVERFGRYPHRNALLGRPSSAEEEAFLTQPGSSF